jgi:2-oxoglutarate dehydrogenase E1 component
MDELFGSGHFDVAFFDEMYAKYKADPNSVEPSWQELFQQIDQENRVSAKPVSAKQMPVDQTARIDQSVAVTPLPQAQKKEAEMRIRELIQAYRIYGHLMAHLNPLDENPPPEPPELNLNTLGFRLPELEMLFPTLGLLDQEVATLNEIIDTLRLIYCNKIGVEYVGTHSTEMEKWLQDHIEPSRFRLNLSIDQKQMILQQLNKSELFESFLHTKYVGQKRFSLEGGETLIPILEAIIEKAAALNTDEFIIGMAHRGRLNVLCNIMNKSYTDIFSEFEDHYIPDSYEGTGDVKYHKGFFSEILTLGGHRISVTLTPNPSHLESVDPVVEGQARARQAQKGDLAKHERVLPILIHGDAAISGQGVVYETLQLSKVPGYTTGGTIHIVINNQIGFTTIPSEARSTHYCTDIAQAFGCPVFHVNAEDPEGCFYVSQLAVEMRQKFHCDVFIDMLCYRKYGHNESDEPAFTQPLEYSIIKKKKTIRELYRDSLIHQGVLEKFMAEQLEGEFKKALQVAMKMTKDQITDQAKTKKIKKETKSEENLFKPVETGVPLKVLQALALRFCSVPEDFNIHPKVQHGVSERLASVMQLPDAKQVDWGTAELLAYATLLVEGVPIRISGQDSSRGTFSHRHAIWIDQEIEKRYSPLSHLEKDQGRFEIYNSPLSEFAVLGFDYGYSMAYPESLVIWEAQFGDFGNGAQVIIDQYIATAEQKWGKKVGITLFLPHGYEGQGPEHSSGRIERFLTLAGRDNMIIVNPSTPVQFFHLLRRQMIRPMRKPLIVFTPKALLRLPACVNPITDFSQGHFEEILEDQEANPALIKRLAFCSGHIYYDLAAAREANKAKDLAVVRIEQLYPTNSEKLKEIMQKYPHLAECLWVQPEPENMGPWDYIKPVLQALLPKEIPLRYIGRQRSAAPAVGSHALHKKEHAAILEAVFPKKPENEIDIGAMQRV